MTKDNANIKITNGANIINSQIGGQNNKFEVKPDVDLVSLAEEVKKAISKL